MHLVDFFRGVGGDLLDVHSALARRHQRDTLRGTVDHHAEVKLLGDVGAFLDQQAAHLLPRRPGLMRDELHAEDLGGALLDLIDRARELDAAALAAPTGVDLRLHHPHGAAECLRCLHRVFDAEGRQAARHRHAEAAQHFLALVFVDLHDVAPSLIDGLVAAAACFGWCQRG